jgi:signal transduction histidine kinase
MKTMTVETQEPPAEVARLLARLNQLRSAERRAASARMVSVIGHLIGTPLNVIAGRAALIRTGNPSPEAIEENSRRIEEQVERLSQRIRRLIDYFGLAESTAEPRALAEVLDDCLALYRPVAEQQGVTLQVSASELSTARIDASLVLLVMTTLLSLAIRTAEAGAVVSVTSSERGPKALLLELNAPGLPPPPGRLDRLEPPEPGVRYDAGALETLWLCLGLAKRSGGSFDVVAATSGAGSTLRLECGHG